MSGHVPPAPPPAVGGRPGRSSRLVAAGFVCSALTLILPPLGFAAVVIGIVLIVRSRIGAGVAVLLLGGIVLPLIGTVIFQALIARPYRVPSGSMEPTLDIGDRVLVDKTGLSDPSRGDIVVFHPPAGAESSRFECGVANFDVSRGQPCARPTEERSDQQFIKRIVAGPGDRLRIQRGRVVLNGKLQKEPFIHPDGRCDICNLPKEITIPPAHYFMLGDNRGASADSRFWGPVPKDSIVGEVAFRYWPLGRVGSP
jgi:signal peptidase I